MGYILMETQPMPCKQRTLNPEMEKFALINISVFYLQCTWRNFFKHDESGVVWHFLYIFFVDSGIMRATEMSQKYTNI